ncbi:FecR family protein [uncultured Alistipes sp.]|jgi:hypothetical protein|uniref:FecR family protein n=1 Tax=uncultured Alistipes sp. TaxID=538949 RepID=UPI0025F9F435|nr:FecR family protein [uncultured Alistipes sp.]
MEDTLIMDAVIQKYFAGETSEQEEKCILDWLEDSEEHKKYFYDLKSVWNARNVFEESTDLARFAAFMRSTDQRITAIDASRRKMRRHRLARWSMSAAAAILFAICAGVAWHFLSAPSVYRIYENNTTEVSTLTLDDGTQVWLNARTKLILRKAFDSEQRSVELSGAAFFEVTHDQGAPFTVHTDNLRVKVLGTAFSVQAYGDSHQAEVILEHGSVRLQTPEGVNLVTLQPDQRALYDASSDNLKISQVNASHLVLTQYDLVTMANATLHEIVSHIETTYGVRLSIPGRYDDTRYAFNYQRSSNLEEVLNIVEYMTGKRCEVIYRKQ